jgi:phospholipid/cholesterol/gamma-HCH transport system substrate-binding protein
MAWLTREPRTRYALLGAAYLLIAVLLVALSVSIYRKVWTPAVWVTLLVDRAGTQLNQGADVKVRGVRVGEVRSIDYTGTGAALRLALDPDLAADVPANVTARLVPTTLFGPRYVDLVPGAGPSAPIADNAVISPDRSRASIEAERVVGDVLPLLRAVQPAQLAATLNAMATALNGRGEQLGQTLVAAHDYLSRFNPSVPVLLQVTGQLATVSDTYAKATPELVGGLADLTTFTGTVADKRHDLARLFAGATSSADTLRGFLSHNRDNLLEVNANMRPTMQLLARYSPEYTCFFRQLVGGIARANGVYGLGGPHPERQKVVISVAANRGKYLPGADDPRFDDHRGPRCYSQDPPTPQYEDGRPLKDGTRVVPPPSEHPNPSLLGLLGLTSPAKDPEDAPR